jgi:hypothetical protein
MFLIEELLIDFHKIIGEHSGKNLAHAVYETQKLYGLKGQASIFYFMLNMIPDMSIGHHSQL